ncbi:putative CRISPR-associated Cas4 nuclease [Sulfolobales Beppu filamentous virus 2]|uniref:Putative CRISPR-associated Cas4 nuclease n=1 Tax=Sulfolobales Beppu filamentous virus 2 TaxID=2493123 RepID=A0A3S8NF25_9VIRU|nr:putative CRISPR-associated Cas4 nuclease [Sulfolobales Beppu filamentous virus 2]AZI75831.1 putative CRISPR-associated Cas4 nuclease [Sulfolobales Beppu filamentous virus 2]
MISIEDIKALTEAEKNKPHKKELRVTSAVTCPVFEIVEYYGLKVGEEKHKKIEEKLKEKGLIPEVEIALTVNDILLKGKIDALDLNNYIVYEIKPLNIKDSYIRQLSLYVWMIRKLTGIQFDGKFLLYNKDDLLEASPSFIDMTLIDEILQKITENSTIKGEYCELCKKNKGCEKKLEWRKNFGFEIREIKKLDEII